jgi:hypothetical protein
MDEKRIPKRIQERSIIGKRLVRKPRRCVNAVEIESREILKRETEKENV